MKIPVVMYLDNHKGYFFFYFLGWTGTESTVTEATKWPIVPALDYYECAAIRGMLGTTGKTLVSIPLCPPQIPHDLIRNRTQVTAVGCLPP
jgi:hypothetical protein